MNETLYTLIRIAIVVVVLYLLWLLLRGPLKPIAPYFYGIITFFSFLFLVNWGYDRFGKKLAK